MNQRDRDVLRRSVQRAAIRAARNPPPGHDLARELTYAGYDWLDDRTGEISDALSRGENIHVISGRIHREAFRHLLDSRKNAA